MALWLFRRRNRRKRSRTGGPSLDEAQRPVPRHQTIPDTIPVATGPLRQPSIKKQRTNESAKLQRRARAFSFDSGRRDSLNVGRKRARRGRRDDVPPVPPLPGSATTGINEKHASDAHDHHETGNNALDDLERIPTLHASKRGGQHLMPRKSSKRRKNAHDREREAELKAMSNFVPHRPTADQWSSGQPLRKDTRKSRAGFSRGLGPGRHALGEGNQPLSDLSLPLAESLHSNWSSDSEQVSWKISALDSLAPKPTLRYASSPRWAPTSGGSDPQRQASQKRVLSERQPFPEETIRAHKRIDELADDLSASDLRELMERDQRRRERKRQTDQEKLERKLARRAENQRQAIASGRDSPPNLERGVLGREAAEHGSEPPSAIITSSTTRTTAESDQHSSRGSAQAGREQHTSLPPTPVRAFHRTESIPLDTEEPAPPEEADTIEEQPPQVHSPTLRGLLRVRRSRSKSIDKTESEKAEAGESVRKGSASSSSRGPLSWTSLFRWGNKNRRNSGPSSFSNTSRDSMATLPLPSAPLNYVPSRRLSSGVPRRTLSRFREDLPDFPISPPGSRGQSPETDPMPPPIIEQPSPPVGSTIGSVDEGPEHVYETPPPEHHAEDDVVRDTPVSWARDDERTEESCRSPEPHSISMASVDSEASWLSGRIGNNRRSAQTQRSRHSKLGGSDGSAELETPEEDVSGITDDEYLSRYTGKVTGGNTVRGHRKSTGEARPSSDEDDDARWGAVGGRVPTVVQAHTVDRVRSREGLLNDFGEGPESEQGEIESPISRFSVGSHDDESALERARSVNLGKGHVRHISAGSARLLDLTPRSSVDARRGLES